MARNDTDIAGILKDNSLSVTKPRLAVFRALDGQEPVSMYELYELLAGQLDRASLYRTITVFEKLAIVTRINIGWKYKIELSDTFSEHHHHLSCIKCGRIIPINETELEDFLTGLARAHRFQPVTHQVEVQGYCSNCKTDT